jgi:hypothetical protein
MPGSGDRRAQAFAVLDAMESEGELVTYKVGGKVVIFGDVWIALRSVLDRHQPITHPHDGDVICNQHYDEPWPCPDVTDILNALVPDE